MAHHPISHIEIPTENPKETSAFYHDVFGWKIETNVEHNYITYQDGGSLRGGFAGPTEPTYKPDRLLVYLATDNLEASLAEVEAHGGKIVLPRTDIPHVGSWAI